jgi:hypothetical protein
MPDDNQASSPINSPDNNPQPVTGGFDPTAPAQSVNPATPTEEPEPTPPATTPPPTGKPDSSVVMTPKGPKKFDRKKLVTAAAAILLLIAGIATGILLIRNQQDLEEEAARVSPIACPIEPTEGKIIVNFNEEVLYSNKDAADATTKDIQGSIPQGNYKVTLVSYDDHSTKIQGQNQESYFVALNNSEGAQIATTNSISDLPEDQDFLTQEVNVNLNLPQQTASIAAFHSAYPPRTSNPNSIVPVCVAFEEVTPSISAQCNQVNAYDINWNLLDSADLSNLEAGNTVRFAVTGSATSGEIDMAKFTVNDVDFGETSEKRVETDEFYFEYDIPEGVVNFEVNAQLHHSELGWF